MSKVESTQNELNVEMKVRSAMQNEQKDDLEINHSLVPLFEQNWMRTLNAKEMESSFKIDLRNVLWWMFIKNTCRPKMSNYQTFKKKVHLFNTKSTKTMTTPSTSLWNPPLLTTSWRKQQVTIRPQEHKPQGTMTPKHIYEVAKINQLDLDCQYMSLEVIIMGTTQSMGIQIRHALVWKVVEGLLLHLLLPNSKNNSTREATLHFFFLLESMV